MDGVQAGCHQDFSPAELFEDISRVEDFLVLSRSPSANFVHLETEPAGLSTHHRMDHRAGSSLLFEDLFPAGFLSDDETIAGECLTAHDSRRMEDRGCASLNAAASSFHLEQPLEQQAEKVRERKSTSFPVHLALFSASSASDTCSQKPTEGEGKKKRLSNSCSLLSVPFL
jgi:hypothetical protein